MKSKVKEEQQIFKINKKNNFFVILSKQNCEQFCSNLFFFVLLQIIEIIQMIYFTFSAPIIGVASSTEDLLINIQNLLKYSHFTVSYRKNDGTFTSLGPLNYENIFIIFSIYTLLFTVIAIVTVQLENLNDERLKKTISRLSSITSIMFYLNFFILSFPTYQLYFIPFECLMNSNSPSFRGNPYYCFDGKHIIFLLISVVGLAIWIVFNCVFSLYVNEYFPESNIPWTGQVTKNNFILFLWKFFASLFLFMSQNGLNRIFIIGIIVVNLVNIIIRYRTPFMFKEVVHFFYSIRECVIFTFTIINYIKYISGISFDFSFLLITIFLTFAFVFLFFRLNDKEQRKIQLSDPFKLKEVNEVELYVMYLMNKIEHIENINYRKDIYGMFLIHQENCEITELFDSNIEHEYRCPCQEIVTYLKLLNFHINYHGNHDIKAADKEEKKSLKEESIKDGQAKDFSSKNLDNDVINTISQMQEGRKSKNIGAFLLDNNPNTRRKDSNFSNNLNDREKFNQIDKKISTDDIKEDEEDEEKIENSENKAMMMKDYYNKAFNKLKQKLFVYVKYLLIYHINNKPNTTKLHLLYSYLNHKKLSRQYKSLYELMQAKYSKGTYIDRFLVFRYTEILEEDINDQNAKKERDYSIDMKELIKFVLNYKTFFGVMEQVAHNSVEFWQEFVNEHPNTVKIYKTGDSIANDYYKLAKYKEYFSETYYNHFAINFTYGCFLKFILNNYKEANIVIHNAVLSKTKNEATTTITDIRVNEEAGLIIISGDLLSFGQMVYMNNNLALMIKFNSKELINANVNILLPKFIASKHDKCIKYFLETGEKRVLDRDVLSFTKNKEGFMCPVLQKVRMIPNLTSGLKFISNIIKLETTSEIIQPNPDLICSDIFIIIISTNYNILGVTENTSKFLGISFCNHTEKKFKDLSLENFITNFDKIKKYFESTKTSTYSDQVDVEIDTTVMKDVIDITENPNIVFGKKKMRMVIQKYQYYKKQIKYFVLKLWDNENKPKPKMINNHKNIDNKMNQQLDFEENGSILSANSLSGEESNNDNGNQSYSQSASDEKSSFLQSENVDDPTISSFQKFIILLIFPFFCLIVIDYVLFFVDNNNKSHIVSYDNNVIKTAVIVERLFLLSRLHLNSISGMEPIQFTKNDFKGMDKLNFTKYNIQNYVSILSNLITEVIHNPLYYNKKINYTDIDFMIIDTDSNLRTIKSPLYKYISDLNTYAATIINYDTKLSENIISNFGFVNNTHLYNLIERQNFYFLHNTFRIFLENFWILIYSDISYNERSLINAWILPNVFLIVYCVLYLCILILILYFSFKIKRRKTLYIDYFTQIEEFEITNLKENCVKFFKFLHGEIVFKDFLHKDPKKGESHHDEDHMDDNEEYKKEENSPEKTADMLSDPINNKGSIPEFKLEKCEMAENSKSGNKKENDNTSSNFQLLSSKNPSNILKTQETHHHTPILENMRNKIEKVDQKGDSKNPEQENILELVEVNHKKEEKLKDSNNNFHPDKKKKKNEPNNVEVVGEIIPEVEVKTPKEIKLENKKKWIIESSKNDKNQVYYFLFGLIVLFVLFDYLFYTCRSNQINSFETIEHISLQNFQREKDLLNFLNIGKEIISFNLDRNDIFYSNFTRLKNKLAKMTEEDFLLMKNKTTFSFLNPLVSNDEKSTVKNNFCLILSDLKNNHFNNFLINIIDEIECGSINNGILQNGILYYIHDVKNIYEEVINKYLIQPNNLTFAKTLLFDEFTNSYPYIYLKYISLFFDYFNDNIIISYLDYTSYLSRISFVLISFFILLVFVGIYFIIKLFSRDIKNARGIICVIPSKYLKNTSQKQKENQENQ